MLAIDTNVVVRYLTGDHQRQSARARALVDGEQAFVPATVMLEAEWVLRSVYGFRGGDVVRALRAFAGLPTVAMEEPPVMARALDLAESGMDFADALHLTKSAHCDGFATFDRKLVRTAKAAGFAGVRVA